MADKKQTKPIQKEDLNEMMQVRRDKLAAFEEKMQMVAEGAVACKTVTELARLHDVEMPIAEAVRQVLWEGRDPHEIIETLFERPVKAEQE